jgi:hypothetical protein
MSSNSLSLDGDIWAYDWGDSYTSARYYKHIHAHIQVMCAFKWLWKSCCMMRVKFFSWLLLVDRLNTRDLLQRRRWKVTEDTRCVLCPTRAREDRMPLFLNATLDKGFGIIYRIIGLRLRTYKDLCQLQSLLLESLFHGGGYAGLLKYLETKKRINL